MDSSSFRNKFMNIKTKSNFNSSTEVDYGRSNAGVPFMWETQPGTPKVMYYCDSPLPPLTPPPSFIYSGSRNPLKKPLKSSLLNSFLPKLNLRRKSRTPPSPTSSFSLSSSSSSSHSVPVSPFAPSYRHGSRRRWTFENNEGGSPISTLCFGVCFGSGDGTHIESSKTMALLEEVE